MVADFEPAAELPPDATADVHAFRRRAADLAEHLQLALAAGELGTWRWDLATGEVVWDAAMERLYGLEPGTFPGTFDAWMALRGNGQREAAQAMIDRAVADGEPYEIETEVVWPDGSVHWLHGWGRATVGPDGEVTGAIGCTADITARKQAEIEARRRASELAEIARRERRQGERLAFLARMTDAALASAGPRQFMDAVARLAAEQLGDWCTLHFVPEPGASPHAAEAFADADVARRVERLRDRYPASAEGGLAAVMRSGEAAFVSAADEAGVTSALGAEPADPDEARQLVDDLHLSSVFTVPLRSTRGVLGALRFVRTDTVRHPSDDDLAFAEAAAGRIAETLSNLWLTEQQRGIARTLQSALLPPALPTVPGVDLAVRYWAAGAVNEVGGDFYDVFAASESRWAVVIGDVCGTGADGAAVATIARHTIRAAATHGFDHTQVVEWLNDAVIAGLRDRFCTTIFATLDPAPDRCRDLTVVAGGHPLPVHVRADGTASTVGSPGTLIGVFPVVKTAVERVRLQPGDTVVLYTDGITDLRPPYGRSQDEMVELVRRAATGASTADETAEAMRAAIEEILPITERADDIALVVIHLPLTE